MDVVQLLCARASEHAQLLACQHENKGLRQELQSTNEELEEMNSRTKRVLKTTEVQETDHGQLR